MAEDFKLVPPEPLPATERQAKAATCADSDLGPRPLDFALWFTLSTGLTKHELVVWMFFLVHVRGGTGEIARATGITEREVCRTLGGLVGLGALRRVARSPRDPKGHYVRTGSIDAPEILRRKHVRRGPVLRVVDGGRVGHGG